MTISILCPNGHKLKVKKDLAGRKVNCPSCGSTIVVPLLQSDPSQDSGLGDLSAYLPAPTSIPNRASPPVHATANVRTPSNSSVGRNTASKHPASKSTLAGINRLLLLCWFTGGCVGGSALGGLILLGIWLGSARNSEAVPSIAKIPQATTPPESLSSAGAAPISVDAESVAEISTKLKRIGLAFHYFHDTYRTFAFVSHRDLEVPELNRNRPRTSLSWRVHLLPFLDQKPLYDSFHLDEPWDSEHNLTLLDKMPEIYRVSAADEDRTRFQVITGPNAIFGTPKSSQMSLIADGITHTILALVVGEDRAVPWTKPDEFTLDPNQPIASLGKLPDRLIKCVMADANPLIVGDDIDPASFMALATPNGKEIVDAEKFRRQFKERSSSRLAKQPNAAETKGNEVATPSVTSGSPADLRAVMKGRMNKLKEVVLAMQNYESAFYQLPISKNPANFDANGKPFLSWRVHLLPFLDQQPLYSQFKMGEPWDSPHNKALIDKMPEVFRDATDKADSVKTRVVTVTGPQTLFTGFQGPKMNEIKDGIHATLLIVFCGSDKAVTWTQPEDVSFDPNAPLACLGKLEEPAIFYGRVDGAVKVLQPSFPADLFKAIVTPKGGEVLPENFDSYLIR